MVDASAEGVKPAEAGEVELSYQRITGVCRRQGGGGVGGGHGALGEEMRVGVEVGDPGTEPGGVDGVLAAGAGLEASWGADAVVVVGVEVYALGSCGSDETFFAAELVGFVFEVAEDVFDVPFFGEGNESLGDVLSDVYRLDVQGYVEFGQFLLQ